LGQLVHYLRGDAVAFSPDSKLVAIGLDDATAKVYSTATFELLFTITGHSSAIRGLSFSPNGEFLFTCSDDNTIQQFSLIKGSSV